MIHWTFLLVAFLLGFGLCYWVLVYILMVAARTEGAIEEACKTGYGKVE